METVADKAALVKISQHHMYPGVKIVNTAVSIFLKIVNTAVSIFLHYTSLGADGCVSNSCNEWQRAHKGLGLSPSKNSSMYRQARVSLNAWNLWKRAHKCQGLSASERSARYKREKLGLCESEVPQELANAGAGRTSAATPVGGGSQRVIPQSLSGDPLVSGLQSPAKPQDVYRFCHYRLLLADMLDPYTQVLDVAVNGLLLDFEIGDSSRLVHATDQVNYVISMIQPHGSRSRDESAADAHGAESSLLGCNCVAASPVQNS